MCAGLVNSGKHTSGLAHIVGTHRAPGDLSRVLGGKGLDDLAIDNQLVLSGRHITLETTVDCVILWGVGTT